LHRARPGSVNHGTTFGPDPDDNPGTLLRVWDHSGVAGPLTVTLPQGMSATEATPVNLRGTKTGPPITVTDGRFTLDLRTFAPASFILD
jgi:hypothetical protein